MMNAFDDVLLPDVSVVIATRGRPQLLRAAVRAILAQDYAGDLDVVVVYDRIEIDPLDDIVVPPRRRLATIANVRTPGLAGGRNSGILATNGELVAFCDDDDEWLPGKLGRQVAEWQAVPDAVMVATGIRIETGEQSHVRLPPARVEFADLLVSRITEIHPSSFLMRRSDLLGDVGLVDEELPASYGEDYDLLLRMARQGHVLAVLEPLVIVHWDRASFFSEKWRGIAEGLSYLLAKHQRFAESPKGSARIEGQVAFAFAALGDRRDAWRWATRTIRHDVFQLRAYAAVAIASRVVPAGPLVRLVNSRGRGL
jgi:glycosyltransferase involved in cell wall biosynthesis